MKYKCLSAEKYELWLTPNKVYEAEIVVSPKEYSGGMWLLVKRADDGFTAYAKISQFIPEKLKEDRLDV